MFIRLGTAHRRTYVHTYIRRIRACIEETENEEPARVFRRSRLDVSRPLFVMFVKRHVVRLHPSVDVRVDTPVPTADVHRHTLLPGVHAVADERRPEADRHQRTGKLRK